MHRLTEKEQENARAALRFLRATVGSWETVAAALGTSPKIVRLANNGGIVTPAMAFCVARLADVGVDDILAGKFVPEGTCPQCGYTQDASS